MDEEAIHPPGKSIIEELNKEDQKEFNQKYGWFEIAINVSETTKETFFQTMDRPAVQVLFLATYLMDKVKQLEAKNVLK